jgi:hypothetical protein
MADDTPKGKGALFRVREKKNDRGSDYTGDITSPTTGEKIELAGWIREDRNGNRYLSLSAQPPRERQQQVAPSRNAYADGRGRDQPQQSNGGRGWDRDEPVPF